MTHLPHDHDRHTHQIVSSIPNIQDFQIVSELFRQLSDGSRIRIFWILCHCEECVINLSAIMEMSSPAISHHLKQLKSAGLVTSRRDGKEVYYRASNSQPAHLLHSMIEELMSISCP